MTSLIFLAVDLLTGADLFKYAETVVGDTPALAATSFILILIFINYLFTKIKILTFLSYRCVFYTKNVNCQYIELLYRIALFKI
jgi:hypothetical protein